MQSDFLNTVYGPMPAGLSCGTLGSLCEPDGVQTGPFGSQLHQEDYVVDGTPIITVEHLSENRIVYSNLPRVSAADRKRLAKYSLRTGDIVFSRVGSVDRRALVQPTEDGWLFSGRCLRVRPKSSLLSSEWLSYFFGLPAFKRYIRGIAVGATMPSINTKILSDVPIYYPPIKVQTKAAEVLAALDNRIDLLRKTNATLESIAQALFKSWFIDFDPVRAKAEGQEPAGMDASTAALFPSQFEDSALGATPRGWKVVPFKELLGSAIGGDWGSEEQSKECSISAAIIRGTDMPDIRAGLYDRVPRRFVSPKKALKRTLADGDLVIEVSGGSKTQPTGRSLYVTKNIIERLGGSVVPTSFCRLFRPRDAETGLLLAQHLDAIYREGKMWGYQVQSTGLANFQTQHFLDSELVVDAPREVLRSFFALVRPLIDRAEKSPITELAALRDTLLPSLISGKLRLPEAQEQVEDALA